MEVVTVTQELILDTLKTNRERLSSDFGIERIGLYGSFARNEQTSKSDIDLVYELKHGCTLSWAQKEQLYRILRRKLHRKMDLVDSQFMNPIIKYYMRKDVIYV